MNNNNNNNNDQQPYPRKTSQKTVCTQERQSSDSSRLEGGHFQDPPVGSFVWQDFDRVPDPRCRNFFVSIAMRWSVLYLAEILLNLASVYHCYGTVSGKTGFQEEGLPQ